MPGSVPASTTSEKNFTPISATRLFEMSMSDVNTWSDSEILGTIITQYTVSQNTIRRKKQNWVNYTRLYLNQYRKDSSPDRIGSKLLFTKFNELYASFASDEKTVQFDARGSTDLERAGKLNKVALFDWDEFHGSDVWNEWLWDTMFCALGILDVSEYDEKEKIMKPKNQSPYLFYPDPLATTRENTRFCGRYIYSTYYELINNPLLDSMKVKKAYIQKLSPPNFSAEDLVREQSAKNILLNTVYYTEPLMANSYMEIMEWYIVNNGKLFRVWCDPSFSFVLGVQELIYKDGPDGRSLVPFVFKTFFSLPNQLWGIGVPDLLEDDHRADVQLVNYFFDSVKADSTPTFLYNYRVFVNPKDLYSREVSKNIPLNKSPEGEVMPYPQSGAVNQSTLAFKAMIENRADDAIGSAKILRGSLSEVDKSATEVAIAKAKQDLILASRQKEMIGADKDFWLTWFARYQNNLTDKDEKLVRLIGDDGVTDMKLFTKADFVTEQNPSVRVVSKLVSEPAKVLQRNDLKNMWPMLQQVGGNLREAMRLQLELSDIDEKEMNQLMPPTPDELRARQENERLSADMLAEIHPEDDDIQHIGIHMRAEETRAKKAHIMGHYVNYLQKKQQAKQQAAAGGGNAPATPPNPPTATPAGAAPGAAASATRVGQALAPTV